MNLSKKEQAVIAKSIAEKKLGQLDIRGAQVSVLEAQELFPKLEGLSELIEAIDVHMAAEKKICGETNWYGVLRVDPLATKDEIKKQYRHMSKIVHPDKNNSVGAVGAFQLVGEAYALLSDAEKRLEYDLKTGVIVLHQETPEVYARDFFSYAGGSDPPSTPPMPAQPTSSTFGEPNNESPNNPFTTPPRGPPPTPTNRPCEDEIFWTKCDYCQEILLYKIKFLGVLICCARCRHLFIPKRMTPRDDLVVYRWPFPPSLDISFKLDYEDLPRETRKRPSDGESSTSMATKKARQK